LTQQWLRLMSLADGIESFRLIKKNRKF